MTKNTSLSIIALVSFLASAVLILFYLPPGGAPAQTRLYRIGIVVRGATYTPGVDGFKEKMKELGYEENASVTYDTHFVDKREDLPDVIAQMLAQDIDLIHAYSTPATTEVYKQTKTIPIVFGSMGDPLASGVVQALESSGTNVTGVSSLSAPLTAKRLEYLVEAVPGIKRVAFPLSLEDVPGKSSLAVAEAAARELGVEIVPYYISAARPVKETAYAIRRKDVDGIVISSDSTVWSNLETYIGQANKEKLPFAVFDKDMVARGGMLGYGPDYAITGAQAAVLADKILKGKRPTDLPIEIPQRLLLVLNLDAARAVGVTFPEALLKKADLIID